MERIRGDYVMAGLIVGDKLKYDEDGISGTATKNTTTIFDFKITKSNLAINGGEILLVDHNWGDYLRVEVIDIDNILGYGENFIADVFVQKKYVHPDIAERHIYLPYAGSLVQNLYIRLKYTNVSTTTDVKIAVNYYLHEMV